MREESDETKLWRWVRRGVVAIVVLPVLYALSIGPMMKLGMKGIRVCGEEQFYRPLVSAMVYSPRFERVMRWYVCDVWHVPMMKD